MRDCPSSQRGCSPPPPASACAPRRSSGSSACPPIAGAADAARSRSTIAAPSDVTHAPSMEHPSRGQQLLSTGEAARREGQPEAARTAFAAALTAFRAEADLAGEARALTRQAQIARDAGDLDWALRDQTEAIALYRRTGDGLGLANALRHAGEMFLKQDRLANATAVLHEALDLYRADIDTPPLAMANMLRSVALLATALGERDAARGYWADARARYAALDHLFAGTNESVAEADRRLADLARPEA
ncbi:hypothetical protein [Sphingomonas sp. KR3-1]|uniref:hypothetical protein n=1 Tax=Sphingomonas sp. KR3-1 TaxID=3156611 RepID=UPI0032B41AED